MNHQNIDALLRRRDHTDRRTQWMAWALVGLTLALLALAWVGPLAG
jgi:hypothetical protein